MQSAPLAGDRQFSFSDLQKPFVLFTEEQLAQDEDGMIRDISGKTDKHYLTKDGRIVSSYSESQYREKLRNKQEEANNTWASGNAEIDWINNRGVQGIKVDEVWQLRDEDGKRIF